MDMEIKIKTSLLIIEMFLIGFKQSKRRASKLAQRIVLCLKINWNLEEKNNMFK